MESDELMSEKNHIPQERPTKMERLFAEHQPKCEGCGHLHEDGACTCKRTHTDDDEHAPTCGLP